MDANCTVEKARLAENDELTPLDAHNSWLMKPMDKAIFQQEVTSLHSRGRSLNGKSYDTVSDSM